MIPYNTKDFLTNLRYNFKKYRQQNKITQSELAEKMGLAQSMINIIESGKRNLTLENLLTFANIVQIPISTLIDEDSTTPEDGIITIPQVAMDVCAGKGFHQFGEEDIVNNFKFDKHTLTELGIRERHFRDIIIYKIDGDSMNPVMSSGDLLLVNKSEDNYINGLPATNDIYIITMRGKNMVKRIKIDFKDKITISSDNPTLDDKSLHNIPLKDLKVETNEEPKIRFHGRVVGILGKR